MIERGLTQVSPLFSCAAQMRFDPHPRMGGKHAPAAWGIKTQPRLLARLRCSMYEKYEDLLQIYRYFFMVSEAADSLALMVTTNSTPLLALKPSSQVRNLSVSSPMVPQILQRLSI